MDPDQLTGEERMLRIGVILTSHFVASNWWKNLLEKTANMSEEDAEAVWEREVKALATYVEQFRPVEQEGGQWS